MLPEHQRDEHTNQILMKTHRLSTSPFNALSSRLTSSSAGPSALEFVLEAELSLKNDGEGMLNVSDVMYALRSVRDCSVRDEVVDTEMKLVDEVSVCFTSPARRSSDDGSSYMGAEVRWNL